MKNHLGCIRAAVLAGISLSLAAPASFAGAMTPTFEDMANAGYKGIEDTQIPLTGGRWEGEPYAPGGASRPSAGLAEGFILRGDVDGDGDDEAVVLLWKSSGGSGTFGYIAVMDDAGGATSNVATAPLGDRVQVRSGSIVNGKIILDVLQQGETDAACCPTQLASRSWILEDGELIEQEADVSGTLSVAVLDGTEWSLTRLQQDQDLPEGVEVTIIFSEGRIVGHSGCNRFSAAIEEGAAPGEIKIGPAMGTRMACPQEIMQLESEFLGLLSQVSYYRFVAGKLVLGGPNDSGIFSLWFESF